jgi:hypothetical protein
MKHTLIRYRTKPELADENQRLIEAVFRELHAQKTHGVRYLALRLTDSTFVHFAAAEGDTSPLTGLGAFRTFQSGVRERCLELPHSEEPTVVGSFRMLGQ